VTRFDAWSRSILLLLHCSLYLSVIFINSNNESVRKLECKFLTLLHEYFCSFCLSLSSTSRRSVGQIRVELDSNLDSNSDSLCTNLLDF